MAEVVDDEYPIWLTTGRVVSQYLSGTQTRRIGALLDQYPQPLCEMHPRLAEKLAIADGDFVKVTSRRGEITVRRGPTDPPVTIASLNTVTPWDRPHWAMA